MSREDDRVIKLGTRGSALARWQAEWIASQLGQAGVAVEIVLIKTTGDVDQQPIRGDSGTGLFTKEIQRAVLDQRVDLAVHSLKDLPTEAVAGLTLAAVPSRESHRDVLVSRGGLTLNELPSGARLGTGSRRRQAQVLHARSDFVVESIRGNVDSRLRKLDEGQFDALVLAEAGLRRLGLEDRVSEVLHENVMLPAVGQGALGLECREDDHDLQQRLQALDDPPSRASVTAERSLLATMQGGCLAPVAAWGRIDETQLQLTAAVFSIGGETALRAASAGDPRQAGDIGRTVAEALLTQGAADLIAAARE